MALYLSCPAVSQIWALTVLPSTWILRVANSTPMVLLLSRLNSLRVKRESRLLLPTPESPIRTTADEEDTGAWDQPTLLYGAFKHYCVCYCPWRHTWQSTFKQIPFVRLQEPASLYHTTAIRFEYFTHKGCVSTKLWTMNEKGTTEEQLPFSPTRYEILGTSVSPADRGKKLNILLRNYIYSYTTVQVV